MKNISITIECKCLITDPILTILTFNNYLMNTQTNSSRAPPMANQLRVTLWQLYGNTIVALWFPTQKRCLKSIYKIEIDSKV